MKSGLCVCFAALSLGCGEAAISADGGTDARAPFCAPSDAETRADGRVVGGAFATRVVSFTPGAGASFGHDRMPDIVLGPPQGAGDQRGSVDAVSLGVNGEIVLAFDDVAITDGAGADFVVFENSFTVPGAVLRYWDELGEVSVSADGEHWATFACDATARPYRGCAGWNVVYANPLNDLCANDPDEAGGEGFDLAELGLREVRYVRIRDLGTQSPSPPAAGFDLDAVSVVHGRRLR